MPAPSLLDRLLLRRVAFVSGKGGVGKSAVAAALVQAAAERGRRALLVEIDAASQAARWLGATQPCGPLAVELSPGLFALDLEPRAVMDEFVRHAVKFEMLARRVIESPIYARFFAAAPGLKELMMLGKILQLEQQRVARDGPPRFDFIVVDAPSTGHGLSFLKVPLAAAAAVPVGPVGHHARRVSELLRDRARCGLVIVALPEEMAVVEAEQFHRQALDEVGIEPLGLVLNACHERRLTPAQEAEVLRRLADDEDGLLDDGASLRAALLGARRHIRRRRLTRFYETRLRRQVALPLVSLPHLFDDALDAAALRRLGRRLAGA